MKIDSALLDAPFDDIAATSGKLEKMGYDGILSFEGQHDPFLPLALAATGTERAQLITGIAIAFARNPMVVACMANDLQLISKGRFTLGLGSQIKPHIEKRFSETWSKPNARMREFIEAVRAIWRTWNEGERLEFRGEFYTHTLMAPFFNPGPNPHGMPEIALAGFGPGMIRVAGEVADQWLVHPLHTPDLREEGRSSRPGRGRREDRAHALRHRGLRSGHHDGRQQRRRDRARSARGADADVVLRVDPRLQGDARSSRLGGSTAQAESDDQRGEVGRYARVDHR